MEMELQRQTLEGYRPVLDCALAQEETLECIVPDALPDVARIVSATGRVFLQERQAGAGTVRLCGRANVTVLYIPEGEDRPRTMEADLPFQCTRDCPQVNEGCLVQAAAWVTFADARDMNPRKLMIRAGLSFQITVYERELREVTCDASDGGEGHLEKRFAQCGDWIVAQVLEKSFLFSDVLRPPASRPAMEELMYVRIQLSGVEAKAIGKKLVCKGEFHLCAVYRSGDELHSAGFELPFSQIFDLEQPVEDGEIELELLVTGMQCALQDGELAVSVESVAQAVIWVRQPLTLLSDAYCTTGGLEVERAPCTLRSAMSREARRETARQLCQSGIPAGQVLDCWAAQQSMECHWEGDAAQASAQIRVEILYLSEDGALCAVCDTLTATCQLQAPEGSDCQCLCAPVGEVTAVPVTGGLEVRCEVLFSWTVSQEQSVPCVLTLKPGVAQASQGPRPSLTIRVVGEGESLWDVAKSCGACMEDIQTVNALEDGQVPVGTLLLIPAKRN